MRSFIVSESTSYAFEVELNSALKEYGRYMVGVPHTSVTTSEKHGEGVTVFLAVLYYDGEEYDKHLKRTKAL